MSHATILLVEDEKNIVELVRYTLEQEGYRVVVATDGVQALTLVRQHQPDLILLDLFLPQLDGFEVCRRLKQDRTTSPIPILMLTAKASEADKVAGLELGADDYLTKPFSVRELVARVRVVLRRRVSSEALRVLVCGTLAVDIERHVVTQRGKPLELSPKEFGVLVTLMRADGRVLSRDHLLETVWAYERALELETRTVDFHISQLRRKLKAEAWRIVTVAGYGYKFLRGEPA